MAEEWEYGNDWGATYDPWYPETTNGGVDMWAGGSPTFNEAGGVTDYFQSPAYQSFTGWGDPTGPGTGGEGGGMPSWLASIMSAIGPLAKQFGGPAATTIGSLMNARRGSNAAQTAGQQESAALNRGIDLQTAQWLQQQQNLAPYLQAGQQGLSQLQQLAGREQPALPGVNASVKGSDYGLPSPYPDWQPRQFQRPDDVNAGAYQWNPQHGPQAQDYRYTPGNIPQASQYRYTPGAVPTLSGKELLANDPGYQFRMDESRKALEGSAAARGDLLSGQNLKALQSRSQDLASQEYGQAWNRASQQAQLREQWGQAASTLGWGQAEAESRLREQVNQIASQQGWSQAQAEAVFREQMAQQSSSQNFGQALAGQQNAFNQGLSAEQWAQKQQEAYATQLYDRQAQQAQQMYGRDVYSNEQDYARQQNAYKQQLSQYLLPWEQQSTLANLGGQAVSAYGTQGQRATSGISELLARLGQTQAGSTYTGALAQNTGTNTVTNSLASVLSRLNS